MDRFLKSVHESSSASSSVDTQSPSKRPSPAAKQGKVSAAVRVAEFGSDKFYADGGKLFCRACNVVVEHTRKSTVQRHLSRKVSLSCSCDRFRYLILEPCSSLLF